MYGLIGKALRLGRIFRRSTGRTVIIALDHGRRHGPIRGIENLRETVGKVLEADIDAVMVTVGMIRHIYDLVAGRVAVIARIDGTGTIRGPDQTDDRLISSVERALKYGADAVSIMVWLGSRNEANQLEKLGLVSELCDDYGMPLLAEVIPCEPYLKDRYSPDTIAYGARIAAEYGADVVKTFYTGSKETFREVVRKVPIPIVVLGGPKKEKVLDVLEMVRGAIDAGGKGVAIGRNVFQYTNPTLMAQALVELVHKGRSVEEVAETILGIKVKG